MGCVASKAAARNAPGGAEEEGKKHSDDHTQAQSTGATDSKGASGQRDAMAMTPGEQCLIRLGPKVAVFQADIRSSYSFVFLCSYRDVYHTTERTPQ